MIVSKKGLLCAAVLGAAIGYTLSTYEDKDERKQVGQAIFGMLVVAGLSYTAAKKGAQIGAQRTIVQVFLQREDVPSEYQELSQRF